METKQLIAGKGIVMKDLRLKCILLFVIYYFFSSFLCPDAKAESKGQKDVQFRWAFGAIVGPKNDRRLVAITRDTMLKTGDQLKMFVELKKECFVYIIYRNRYDEITLLFPYRIEQFEKVYETSRKYYVPKGDMWFELDENAGRETFYLLASAKPLYDLETLLKEHANAKAENKNVLAERIAGANP